MSTETKRDHLRSLAGNIAESMGVGVAPGNAAVQPHLSASPLSGAKGRMDGLTRSRNVAEIPVDKIGPNSTTRPSLGSPNP